MKILLLLLICCIVGCGTKAEFTKTPDGMRLKGNRAGIYKYKDKEVEAEVDTKGQKQ